MLQINVQPLKTCRASLDLLNNINKTTTILDTYFQTMFTSLADAVPPKTTSEISEELELNRDIRLFVLLYKGIGITHYLTPC